MSELTASIMQCNKQDTVDNMPTVSRVLHCMALAVRSTHPCRNHTKLALIQQTVGHSLEQLVLCKQTLQQHQRFQSTSKRHEVVTLAASLRLASIRLPPFFSMLISWEQSPKGTVWTYHEIENTRPDTKFAKPFQTLPLWALGVKQCQHARV